MGPSPRGGSRVSPGWVAGVLKRFEQTGGVETWQGRQPRPPPNALLTPDMYGHLINQLLNSPRAYLDERCDALELATGKRVSLSVMCQAIRKLG